MSCVEDSIHLLSLRDGVGKLSVVGDGHRRRVLLDASMVRMGGGYTHLMNLLPEISRVAPDLDFMLLASPALWSEDFDDIPNLEFHPVSEGECSDATSSFFFGRAEWLKIGKPMSISLWQSTRLLRRLAP